MKMSLNKASKVFRISKETLKQDIKSGILLMSDGCLDYDQLKQLYPDAVERAENGKLEYYAAIKETAGSWKNDARTRMANDMDKHQLVNQIRKLDAENHMLRKRIAELEKRQK